MSTFASAKELKYRAKYHMVGRFGVAINALITIQLFLTGLTILINLVCDRATVPGLILFYLLQIMVTILSALFASGHCYLYLNICCNRPADGSVIYYGFKNQPEKAILIQVYQTLLYFACMLPGVACAVLGLAMQQYGVVGVGGILLALSGIVIMYLALAFSQAFYLLHDFPDASAQALLKMSAKIMKGYKFKLFCLLCSFIPLLLFAFLSFGIGLLWVQPYMNAATAEFFLEVMRARE